MLRGQILWIAFVSISMSACSSGGGGGGGNKPSQHNQGPGFAGGVGPVAAGLDEFDDGPDAGLGRARVIRTTTHRINDTDEDFGGAPAPHMSAYSDRLQPRDDWFGSPMTLSAVSAQAEAAAALAAGPVLDTSAAYGRGGPQGAATSAELGGGNASALLNSGGARTGNSDDEEAAAAAAATAAATPAGGAAKAAPAAAAATAQEPLKIFNAEDPRLTPGFYWAFETNAQKMVFTGAERADGGKFSDSSFDALMNFYFNKTINDAAHKDANLDFAKQIENVIVNNDKGAIEVQVRLKGDIELTLTGQLTDIKADLKPVTNGQYQYVGRLVCWDATPTCQSSVIEILRYPLAAATQDPKKSEGQYDADAYIVHRLGPAVLNIKRGREDIHNEMHQKFDSFLKASANNACIDYKGRVSNKAAVKALEQACPGNQKSQEGALQVLVNSWAVAHGHAKFYVVFSVDAEAPWIETNSLRIGGDLVVSDRPENLRAFSTLPDFQGKWLDSGEDSAQLMANDATGKINVRLHFAGQPSEDTRFSVTTRFAATKTPTAKNKAKRNKPKRKAA